MFDDHHGMFSSRAFVCMADLLFGLSAGVLFLNAMEAEDLAAIQAMEQRKIELERHLLRIESGAREWDKAAAEMAQQLEQIKQLQQRDQP